MQREAAMKYQVYNTQRDEYLVAGKQSVNGLRPVVVVKMAELSKYYSVWSDSATGPVAGGIGLPKQFTLSIDEVNASVVPSGASTDGSTYIELAGKEFLPPLTLQINESLIYTPTDPQFFLTTRSGEPSVYLMKKGNATDTWELRKI
jgi:hypothetical protein